MKDKTIWIGAAIVAAVIIALTVHVSFGKPTPVTVTKTVTVPLLLEDHDSDPGDNRPTESRAKALTAVRTAGAPGIVSINPAAEPAADQGGATPKGLTNATSCGVERAAVKHLTDGFTLPAPTVMTVDQLVNMAAPPVTPDSARLPQEQVLVELDNVHIVAAKQEADSDLHVIIATATGAEMNVEAPQAVCDSASPYAAELAQARANMDAALGTVSTTAYTPENVTATVRGVLFFDVLHGQRGAPNGIELHPVTFFSTGASPAPVTTTTSTTTASTTTATTTTEPTTTAGPATTTTSTTARDSDYRTDAAECGHTLRGDSDRRDDTKECRP